MNDIKQRIEAGLIGSTGEMIQELFVQAAKKVINQKQGKRNKDEHKRRNKGRNKKNGLIKNVIIWNTK